jgi:hypothetical protein
MASLESRDPKVLEGLAQTLSSYSIVNVRDSFEHKISGKSRHDKRFLFWRRAEWIWGQKELLPNCRDSAAGHFRSSQEHLEQTRHVPSFQMIQMTTETGSCDFLVRVLSRFFEVDCLLLTFCDDQ